MALSETPRTGAGAPVTAEPAADPCAIDLGDGLTYVERPADGRISSDPYLAMFWRHHATPAAVCELYVPGEAAPVSYLHVMRYTARIGAAEIAVEGFSSGATVPAFRRRGLFTVLIRQAMQRSRIRTSLLFLKGIDGFYGRLGFVPCIPQRSFRVGTDGLAALRGSGDTRVRRWRESDRADGCRLYNRVHRLRPCTAVRRPDSFQGARPATAWEPGDHAIVAERDNRVVGYALAGNLPYGQNWREYQVREIVCDDDDAAAALLGGIAEHASQSGRHQVLLDEPEDSPCGAVLRTLDCMQTVQYSRDGGWMAAVLDGGKLAASLGPEVRRRFGERCVPQWPEAAVDAAGREGRMFLQLLLGALSWSDYKRSCASSTAQAPGVIGPCDRAGEIPLPFIHSSDRY